MKRNMIIGGALAIAGAAYLYKRYRSGKGAEEVKDLSRKAKHHLTNIFSRAKGHANSATA
ncbi:hypothetical protein LZZ85_20030 [Terrimonas sp. NA20]|jgi:hypothetical protein|uniref:YtxH domain-containing protein n=1 Tax=Terrimonas ginsenosidimutans TaxID=2908004 RepID=A0ABS9KWJ6_9BACT|nr:hypothetical protein [Terrimonas ginsenosidimutans]MCG2616599.1 hypothetical protein [Terrimonas ginsenosidimutans]